MKNTLYILLTALALTGCCSKLKVTVKTADRDTIIKNAGDIIKSDIMNSIISLEKFVANSTTDQEIIVKNIIKYREAKHPNYPFDENTKQLFKDTYTKKVNLIDLDVKAAVTEFNKASATNAAEQYTKAYKHIDDAKIKMYTLINDINKQATSPVSSTTQSIDTDLISNTTLSITNKTLDNNRLRYPILGDPLTSFVTKDINKHIWKSLFNKTVSSTFFGNSDIAIILRSNPPEKEIKSGDYNNNFTIKGVRMDAADATNAFFTGLTQTMNFIANTQGIPLSMGQSGTTDNPTPARTQILDDFETDRKAYELKKKKLNDAKAMLLKKIEIENIQTKRGEALNAAAKRIEDYWTELKKQLK